MPRQTIYADPEIYHFFIRHPDLVIGYWEQLGATQLSLREVKENRYVLKESSDTTATIDVLLRTDDMCIVYAKGEYRGPLLSKPYHGEVILVLRSRFTRDESNEPMVVCDLDAFIQINSLGADVLAKLFFASLTKIADSNFEITTSFVSQVSKAAARNTANLKSITEEITSVRQEVCADFYEVVDRVALRYARRNQPIQQELAQERTRSLELAQMERQDFSISLKPPSDWEMDHFVDSPQSPFTTPVRYENSDNLNVPKSRDSQSTGAGTPKLPKPARR